MTSMVRKALRFDSSATPFVAGADDILTALYPRSNGSR